MSEHSVDRVSISKEANAGRISGPAPSWVTPVLKRFYEFTRKWAGTFSNELDESKKREREEEMVKAVNRSFKGQV